MIIHDLDHMEDIPSVSIAGGAISLNFNAPIGVVFIAATEQNAKGTIAINKADVGINFFDRVNFKF